MPYAHALLRQDNKFLKYGSPPCNPGPPRIVREVRPDTEPDQDTPIKPQGRAHFLPLATDRKKQRCITW